MTWPSQDAPAVLIVLLLTISHELLRFCGEEDKIKSEEAYAYSDSCESGSFLTGDNTELDDYRARFAALDALDVFYNLHFVEVGLLGVYIPCMGILISLLALTMFGKLCCICDFGLFVRKYKNKVASTCDRSCVILLFLISKLGRINTINFYIGFLAGYIAIYNLLKRINAFMTNRKEKSVLKRLLVADNDVIFNMCMLSGYVAGSSLLCLIYMRPLSGLARICNIVYGGMLSALFVAGLVSIPLIIYLFLCEN